MVTIFFNPIILNLAKFLYEDAPILNEDDRKVVAIVKA